MPEYLFNSTPVLLQPPMPGLDAALIEGTPNLRRASLSDAALFRMVTDHLLEARRAINAAVVPHGVAAAVNHLADAIEQPRTGYMVLNRDGRTHWDGEVHPDLGRAQAELRAAESNVAQNGTGWYLAELREVTAG